MLPQDPVMLFSMLNMKLRDSYSSLSSLCDDLDIDEASLLLKMEKEGYTYNIETNQFKAGR